MAASRATVWRVLSGILGVICLLLATILGLLLNKLFSEEISLPTTSAVPTTEAPKDTHCYSCQQGWIGYKYSCYFISEEAKTWTESRRICLSQNSTLLHKVTKQELVNTLNFMKHNARYYWIGIFYSSEQRTWLWQNGSALLTDLPSQSQSKDGHCVSYSPRTDIWTEPCSYVNRYICKKQPA